MDAYYPMFIWLVAALVCALIARYRGVKHTFLRDFTVVLLGPLAIPLVFFMRPEQPRG